MILVDTNVLVGFAGRRDGLHRRVVADLKTLARRDLFVTSPVLAETFHLLTTGPERARARAFVESFGLRPWPNADAPAIWAYVFEWMAKYAEHSPDWADGHLVALTDADRSAKVWTYDREFVRLWRRLDGSAVPLAIRRRD